MEALHRRCPLRCVALANAPCRCCLAGSAACQRVFISESETCSLITKACHPCHPQEGDVRVRVCVHVCVERSL